MGCQLTTSENSITQTAQIGNNMKENVIKFSRENVEWNPNLPSKLVIDGIPETIKKVIVIAIDEENNLWHDTNANNALVLVMLEHALAFIKQNLFSQDEDELPLNYEWLLKLDK